jgi:hypothetical protein
MKNIFTIVVGSAQVRRTFRDVGVAGKIIILIFILLE